MDAWGADASQSACEYQSLRLRMPCSKSKSWKLRLIWALLRKIRRVGPPLLDAILALISSACSASQYSTLGNLYAKNASSLSV